MSLLIGMSLIIAIPGLVVGAFFAFKYIRYERSKAPKDEEDRMTKRKRSRR